MVLVGRGPTGVEFVGELQDFSNEDLKKRIPEINDSFHVTLVEVLRNVLPIFSKQLIDYTESTFKEEEITIHPKTMVKKVTDKYIEVEVTDADGTNSMENTPNGLLAWATGHPVRPVVRDSMSQIRAQKDSRVLAVNKYLVVNGVQNIWALGDCAITSYAPTARLPDRKKELHNLSEKQSEAKSDDGRNQVVDEIRELQRQAPRSKLVAPFGYSHQGSLAYIGKERAAADISWLSGNIASGGTQTYLFWSSAYLSIRFSTRNSVPVAVD